VPGIAARAAISSYTIAILKGIMAVTSIVRMMLLLAFLFIVPAPVLAVDLTGTVVSVNGMDVTIKALNGVRRFPGK
jgi:hypothetical protein